MESKHALEEDSMVGECVPEQVPLIEGHVRISVQPFRVGASRIRLKEEASVFPIAGNDVLAACSPQSRGVLTDLASEIEEGDDDREATDEIAKVPKSVENFRLRAA